MTCTPDSYPAEVADEVTEQDLRDLRERFLDPEDPYGQNQAREWPPRDANGTVYPIWYPAEDVDHYGKLYDSDWNRYDPFGGNLSPDTRDTAQCGVCNAPLNNWRDRYQNLRLCGQLTKADEYLYCPNHKNRRHVMKSAEEHVQTGLWTNSLDHYYERIGPLKRILGWGTFESLMGESNYTFAVEYEQKTFDFSNSDLDRHLWPEDVDDDGILQAKCGYPTEHGDAALALYVAAMMSVQMVSVQPRIMEENREEGTGMMETKSVEAAQLTAPPSEHDPSPQQFETLETWSEHHLNLPLSRLVRDRPKLLERGGVSVDPDADSDTVEADEVVLEIEAESEMLDTESSGTDPNALGGNYTAESEKILDNASEE